MMKIRNSTLPKNLPQLWLHVLQKKKKLQRTMEFGKWNPFKFVLNLDFQDLIMLLDHQCLLIQDLSLCPFRRRLTTSRVSVQKPSSIGAGSISPWLVLLVENASDHSCFTRHSKMRAPFTWGEGCGRELDQQQLWMPLLFIFKWLPDVCNWHPPSVLWVRMCSSKCDCAAVSSAFLGLTFCLQFSKTS